MFADAEDVSAFVLALDAVSLVVLAIGGVEGAGLEATLGVSAGAGVLAVAVVSVVAALGVAAVSTVAALEAAGDGAVSDCAGAAFTFASTFAWLDLAALDFAFNGAFATFGSRAGAIEVLDSVWRVVSLTVDFSGAPFSTTAGAGGVMSFVATVVAGSLGAVVVDGAAAAGGVATATLLPSCLRCWSIKTAPPSTLTVMTPIAIPN